MTNEQEIVWSVFGVYLNDLKAYSTKPDRPTFKRLEEVRDRAIKALEQQPCEDCVKREDAKKFLYERLDRLNDDELYDIFSKIIDDMYNELPSVTPKTRWIPVSEGFPKHKDILVMDEGEDMFVAWYESEGLHEGWHSTDNGFDYDTPIIAWMPLPQPYKECDKE